MQEILRCVLNNYMITVVTRGGGGGRNDWTARCKLII